MAESLTTASRSRRVLLAIAGLFAVGLTVWLARPFMAPINQSNAQDARPGNMSAPDVENPPTTPPDPATSLLGTASSISPDVLTLVLVATSPGRTSRDGTASLGTDPRNPQTYAAGALLVNGAVIEEIHADHVVLELGGKRSILAVGGKTSGQRLSRFIGSSNEAATTVGGAEFVNRPLDTVASSREDMSDIIRPEPIYELDRVAGIKVLPGRDKGRFELLGLQAGDIVRTIDGKPLRAVDAAWQAIDDALSTGTRIVVSIERDGNLMSVFLDGSKLAQEPVHIGATALPVSPGS